MMDRKVQPNSTFAWLNLNRCASCDSDTSKIIFINKK